MGEPARRTQQERSELSTARMLDAAADLIAEGGYEAMTLAAVGERAGYSRGLATARFGSKAQLLAALVDRVTLGWSMRNVVPRQDGRPGREGVAALIDAIRVQADRDPRVLRILYALMFEALGPNAELRSRFVEHHVGFRADLAQLIERGRHDGSVAEEVDPAAEAALVVAELRGIAYQWLLDTDAFEPVAALCHLGWVVDRRLRPDRSRSSTGRRNAQGALNVKGDD